MAEAQAPTLTSSLPQFTSGRTAALMLVPAILVSVLFFAVPMVAVLVNSFTVASGGKTTFTRHLLRALGVQGPIKSPSYTVMETYALPDLMHWPISHCDFYRFKDPQEWEDAGLRDVFAHDGLKLCEWPDKAMGFLPLADLALEWQVNLDESRTVQLLAHTPAGEDVLP